MEVDLRLKGEEKRKQVNFKLCKWIGYVERMKLVCTNIFRILYIFIYILVHTAVCVSFKLLWYISFTTDSKKIFVVFSFAINFSAGNSQKMWRV